jgi:hypothetical protein
MSARLEYARFRLGPEISVSRLNELGAEGWQLCVMDGGEGIFCRNRDLATLRQRGDEWARGLAAAMVG